MEQLLDESIPGRLAVHFPNKFEIKTVPQMGWAGTGNGELLRLAAEQGFNALVTADQGIEHQQNLTTLPISVIVMVAHRTRLEDLKSLVPGVVDALRTASELGVYRVVAQPFATTSAPACVLVPKITHTKRPRPPHAAQLNRSTLGNNW